MSKVYKLVPSTVIVTKIKNGKAKRCVTVEYWYDEVTK